MPLFKILSYFKLLSLLFIFFLSFPKAFEIFTSDKTYVLKAKDGKNAEEWVQCLSIAVACKNSQFPGGVGMANARDNPSSSRPVSQHFSIAQSQFGLRTAV